MRLSKPKRRIAVACLLTIGVACIVTWPWRNRDDEARYRQYIRQIRLTQLLFPALNDRPSVLARPIEFVRRKLFDGIHSKEESLVASGYLTNVSILLTNATKSRLSGSNTTPTVNGISTKLHGAASDYRFLPFSLRTDARSNVSVDLQCRTKDVELYKQVLANE
jgi:hypothetical protein